MPNKDIKKLHSLYAVEPHPVWRIFPQMEEVLFKNLPVMFRCHCIHEDCRHPTQSSCQFSVSITSGLRNWWFTYSTCFALIDYSFKFTVLINIKINSVYQVYKKNYIQFKPKHLFLTDPEKVLSVLIRVIQLITYKDIFHAFCATLHIRQQKKRNSMLCIQKDWMFRSNKVQKNINNRMTYSAPSILCKKL